VNGRLLEPPVFLDYHLLMIKQQWWKIIGLIAFLGLLLWLLTPNGAAFGSESYQVEAAAGGRLFDFVTWEWQALQAKATAVLSGGTRFLNEETQKGLVLDYLEAVNEINRLNWEIAQIFTDPDIADPQIVSQEKQAALAAVRQQMTRLQPLAEAVVQDQVGMILAEEKLALAGQVWPPVLMHMTPLPSILITSPRDHIERTHQLPLEPGLTPAEMDEMETAVLENADLSALIVPIGGLATYPAMIMETSSVTWLPDVTAHEWAHHWLMPYPVSLNYLADPQVRTINETVASIVGREVGAQVVARYYPEFAPPPITLAPEPAESLPTDPPAFDFRAEMAATRRLVDELLADGDIEGAEAYMEARRRLFVENGYQIRKLNQAYFAFYGAYADEPGAAGDDPIGPTLLALRAASPSLRDFLRMTAQIGSLADLERLATEMGVWNGGETAVTH